MSVIPINMDEEYKKHPDITPDDIRPIREWLTTQPHLPGQHLTDLDLILLYHCCEKSIGVTKQVLDLHFTLRTLFTNYFFDRRLDKKTELALNSILIAQLPCPTEQGYRVMYCRLLEYDPRYFDFNDGIKAFMMLFDLWQYAEGTWPGFIVVIDMDKTTLGHVAKLDVMSLKKVLYFLQECMLVKLKGVFFMNAPYFMDKLMMLIRPFLKKELIQIHAVGTNTIYEHIPQKSLPKEQGGEYKSCSTIRDENISRLRNNVDFFKMESKKRVNEALRPGKKSTVENLFGIQGSFKKLDID